MEEKVKEIFLKRFIPSVASVVLLVIINHISIQSSFERMNTILQKYEINLNSQLLIIERTEILLFFLILFMIVFLIIFIFLPTFKRLSKAFYEVKKSNENIMELFRITHGAMFLIEPETCNVILMNRKAERLISSQLKEGMNIKNYFKIKSRDSCDVIKTIKENEYNENMETELILNDNKKMYVIVTFVKTHFDNKDAVLMGLFDISMQKECEETFKKMAIKDNLTGLYNRYYFEKRANAKIVEAEKYGEPISMLMLDLDQFKSINDTYGHPVGDEVLKLIAYRLKSIIRKADYIFRVGGEEFVVLMPKTNILAADIVAEKVRLELENTEHDIAGKITVSIGVAERRKLEVLDDWYKRVDQALYSAKESGRNCVMKYE